MEQILEEKLDEIISWAEKNANTIQYNTVIDILKEKDKSIEKKEIRIIFSLLEEKNIHINRALDEDYPADGIDFESFIPADVNIGQRPSNVYNLMERLLNYEIDLEPPFQRNSNLWSLQNQSRLIESLMLKIPLPAFYFNAIDEAKWIVIDGLQRLTAFQNYLVGIKREDGVYVKEKFVGLQYLTEFNGITFDELPRQYVRRIKEAPIVAYTVEKGTPDIIVYNIFQRINTGGLCLNAQEIRQAMYHGTATELIQKLAQSEAFLEATQYAISKERMIDREYVTRFIAFTELDYEKEYKGNIDSFLIKGLKKVNQYSKIELERIEFNFKRVMFYCERIFGRFAFRKFNENGRRGPINKALFELWSICFAELSDESLDKILNHRDKFLENCLQMMQRKDFITALKAGDQYSTIRRIDIAKNMLKEFI